MNLSAGNVSYPSNDTSLDRSIHSNFDSAIVKRDASAQSAADCTITCKRCTQLEHKVKELETIIKKLTQGKPAGVSHPPVGQSPSSGKINAEKGSPSNLKMSPKQLRYSFDLDDANHKQQEKLLHEIQQKAEKLCRKERKEREIIKKIVQSNQEDMNKLNESKHSKESLSKSEISPIKRDPIKLLKLPKTNSLILQPFSPIKEEPGLEKDPNNRLVEKTEAKVLDIPSSVLIEEIPKRQGARASVLKTPILDNEQIEQYLSGEKPNEPKSQKESTEEAISQSRLSQSMASRRSQKETEDVYNTQMRNSKLMAKFKRKK